MSDVTLLIKARNEASAALQSVKGDMQEIQRASGGLKESLKNASAEMRNVGMGLAGGVTLPLVGIATAAITSAADFEQSLNVMQQVSGATETQMAALQAQALQLGAETAFSAGEAATAMLELGKAGLSVEEVGAAIGGTMDLAAAGNLGLAQAAEIAANAVNSFSLDASATVDVANMLAAAANASSVEVVDLADGMKNAGAVFAAGGQSIGDLTTAMALLGNNGIKGAEAGTGLKVMLQSLATPTSEAADVMAQLGVSMYDLDGTARALPDVMADLQSALYGTKAVQVTSSNLTAEQTDRMQKLAATIANTQSKLADYQSGIAGVAESENDKIVSVDRLNRVLQAAQAEYNGLAAVGGTTSTVMREMTDAQRDAALQTIFGTHAITSARVLLKEGADGWATMAEAVGQQGAATEVAGARMKGMAGAIEYIKGSIDSFLIGTALPYLDTMSGIVRQVADAISAFGGLPEPIKQAGLAFAVVLAAAGPVLLALSGIATAIGFILSPIGLVIVAVAGLAAAWTMNFGGIQEATAAAWGVIAPALQGLGENLQSFGLYMLAVVEDGDYLNDWLTHLPVSMQGPVLAIGQMTAAFQEGLGVIVPQALSTVQGAWASAWGEGFPQIMAGAQAAWQALMTLLEPGLVRLQDAFATAQVQVAALEPQFGALLAAVQNMWVAVQPVLEAFGALVAGTIAVTAVFAVNLLAQVFNNLGTIISTVLSQVTLTLNSLALIMTDTVTLVKAIIDGDWQTAWTAAQSIVGTFGNFVRETFSNLWTMAATMVSLIYTSVVNTLEDMGVDTEGIMNGIKTWWDSIWDGLQQKIQPIKDAVDGMQKGLEDFQSWLSTFSLPNPFAGWSIPGLADLQNQIMNLVPGGGGGGSTPQNALGTAYFPGGWSWVGESGREMVRLPRGAEVIPNRQAERMAAGLDRVAVTVQQMIVRDDRDIYAVAYQVADILMRA